MESALALGKRIQVVLRRFSGNEQSIFFTISVGVATLSLKVSFAG